MGLLRAIWATYDKDLRRIVFYEKFPVIKIESCGDPTIYPNFIAEQTLLYVLFSVYTMI